jgi:hypothetical protein
MPPVDETLRHLLLRLAEDLDPGVLPVLADRLEELGDVRAGEVRGYHDRRGLLRIPVGQQDGAACRYALELFPEGPRWALGYGGPDRFGPEKFLAPADASRKAARLLQEHGCTFSVTGPLWPAPA